MNRNEYLITQIERNEYVEVNTEDFTRWLDFDNKFYEETKEVGDVEINWFDFD